MRVKRTGMNRTRTSFLLLALFAACSDDPVKAIVNHDNSDKAEADRAIQAVIDLPETRAWLALFCGPDGTGPAIGGRPSFTVDRREGGRWIVHAFESTSTHTATFNWYAVDLTNGTVQPEF
jgi:hypothetical protein